MKLVKMRSYCSRVGPSSNVTGVLVEDSHVKIDTHVERMPHDDKGRDWICAAISKGTPKMASTPQEARNARNDSPTGFRGKPALPPS